MGLLKSNWFMISYLLEIHASPFFTQAQKSTFYPEINKNLMFEKCEFCEKSDYKNVNFVKNETLKNVNYVKNETLKL